MADRGRGGITSGGLAIAASRVYKRYGRTRALNNVVVEAGWGQTLLLLGPNGAGKSTLLRVLAGLTRPDQGSIRMAGFHLPKQRQAVQASIGYMGHHTLLYGALTPRENLRFYARLYGLTDADTRAKHLLAQLGSSAWADRRVDTLSHGMQKRIGLARALLHRPAILLLDEPESGLDQQGTRILWEVLHAVAASGATVVLTTHNPEQSPHFADKLLVLEDGYVRFHGPRHGPETTLWNIDSVPSST